MNDGAIVGHEEEGSAPLRRAGVVTKAVSVLAVSVLVVFALTGCGVSKQRSSTVSSTLGPQPTVDEGGIDTDYGDELAMDSLAPVAISSDLTLLEAGTLVVCTAVPLLPFEYFENATDERIVGIDADLLRSIAALNGYEIRFVDLAPSELYESLGSRCDLVAAAAVLTERLGSTYGVSAVYFRSATALLVRADGSSRVEDLQGMKGKRLGVVTETLAADLGDARSRQLGFSIRRYDTVDALTEALRRREIDAGALDLARAGALTKADASPIVVSSLIDGGEEDLVFVTARTNGGLVELLDKSLERLRDKGVYDRIITRYLGS